MPGKQNEKSIIPAIEQIILEVVKQNILAGQRMDAVGQRMDAVGQRLDAMGQRMDASMERQDKKFDEIRSLFLKVIERLHAVEQTLGRLPDAVNEKIGFTPVSQP